MKKLSSKNGLALIFGVLIFAIIVMLVLIFIPTVKNMQKQASLRIDRDYEETAKDSAYMEFIASGGPFTVIYDSEKKCFVDNVKSLKEFDQITPYGNAEEHIGKVILIHVAEDGDITLTWIGRNEYKKVNGLS